MQTGFVLVKKRSSMFISRILLASLFFFSNSYFRMVFGTHDIPLNIVHSNKTSLFRVYLIGENKKHSEPSSRVTSRCPHWVI